MLLSLGPSLVGARVFASTDLALSYAPWRATQPAGAKADNPCVSDPVDGFLPAAALFRRDLLHGDVAQWDGLDSGGAPLAAVPSNATWSPLSVPYLVLPTWLAPAWVKLLEMGVSIGGMFLLLRRLRLARAPALLGGLIYTTSGFMVSWTNWPHTRTAAFVPVLLWSLERLVQLRTPRAAVPVALSVAALLLGGFPAVTGLALYLAAPYLLMRVLMTHRAERPVRASLSTLVLAGVGVALGVVLVAFQLLPFLTQLDSLDLDVRAQSPAQHLPLLTLVTAALPKAFGTCPGHDYVGPINQVEVNAYIGSAVLVLVVLAFLRRRRPETPAGVRGFFGVATIIVVVLGWLGGKPLGLAQHLPVFSNNPVGRIRVLLGLCLAVLAAMGYDALLRARQERSSRRRAGVELAVWAGLAVVALLVIRRLRANLRPTHYLAQSDRQTLYAALATAVVLAAVALARTRLHRLAVAVVPVVVLAQALNVVLPYWPQLPRHDFYPTTPAHDYLAAHLGHERFQGTAFTMLPGTNVYYGLRSLGGHSFTAVTWRQLMESADPTAFRTATFSTIAPTLQAATSPALDRFAVRYLVSDPAQPAFGTAVPTAAATGQVLVPAHGQVAVPFAGGPLRGAGVTLAAAPAVDGYLRVDVVQGGKVLAASGRRLLPTTGAGDLPVTLAGEDLPRVPLVLRIRNTSNGPVLLAAVAGRPVLHLVRPADDGLRVAEASVGATVWERTRALPRLRWASTVRIAQQGAASLAAAGSTAAEAGEVVLAANPDGARGGAGSLRAVHDGADVVAMTVKADGAGYVVVADGLQSTWTATVDGRPAPLLKADHALVAVPVPAGTHRVQLSYAPRGFRAGFAASAAGLVGLLGLSFGVGDRVRRRRRAGRGSDATVT